MGNTYHSFAVVFVLMPEDLREIFWSNILENFLAKAIYLFLVRISFLHNLIYNIIFGSAGP